MNHELEVTVGYEVLVMVFFSGLSVTPCINKACWNCKMLE